MKKKFWDKRIPSLLGLLFLAISVGMVAWFGGGYTELRGRASVEETPKNVQISNITDTSFTVFYTTDIKTEGAVAYARDPSFGQVGLDDRDRESGKPSLRQVHYVTLTQLDAGTKYYFAIQSGATTHLNNSQPYEVTTATVKLGTPPNKTPIAGTVNLEDGSIPLEGIVFVDTSASPLSGAGASPSAGLAPSGSAQTSQILSVLLREDGSYILPISSMRTKDLATYIEFTSETKINLTILNATSQSRVSLLANQTSPVPLITLSKDYDFAANSQSITNPTASGSGTTLSGAGAASTSGELTPNDSNSGFPLFPATVASGPAILTPENDENFIDPQPIFAGTALPNATVEIIIQSDETLQASVQSDNFGNWQYRPPLPLTPGEHIFTIIARDTNGILQTINRNFTVYASGSQFNEPSIEPTIDPNATPTSAASATPTQSPTPTINVTPISLPTPTTSSISATPDLTLTISPTPNLALTMAALSATPDPASLTATAMATGATIAPSGNFTLLFAGFIAALSITAGFVLFFL